jgi:hypothetical protein
MEYPVFHTYRFQDSQVLKVNNHKKRPNYKVGIEIPEALKGTNTPI